MRNTINTVRNFVYKQAWFDNLSPLISHLSSPKGQSLIEVLVALGLISLIITGVATVITTSLNNAQFSQDQATATKYAQEGLEITRSIRESNSGTFAELEGTYCLAKGATALGPAQLNCTQPNTDHFIRSVRIERAPGCGANVSKIIATVTWTDGKCNAGTNCHKSELVSCLSRVNPV